MFITEISHFIVGLIVEKMCDSFDVETRVKEKIVLHRESRSFARINLFDYHSAVREGTSVYTVTMYKLADFPSTIKCPHCFLNAARRSILFSVALNILGCSSRE